jgi:K+-transporting ATPase KdpF subunit
VLNNVRFADACFHRCILRRRHLVCAGVRAAEVMSMSVTTASILVLTILLIGYLVFALLYPEKF